MTANPDQLPLPLDWKAARDAKDYFVSTANRDAVRFLDSWATWPIPIALLIGPPGAGKTHLAAIFARRANARLIDDADRMASEEGLFHAWNEALADRRPLLLTARAAPGDWNLALPDLKSRLLATPQVRIGAPDDALLAHVFEKMWRDRGIAVAPEVTRYVLTRIERSFDALGRAVMALDRAALAGGRALTIPLAREALLDAARDADRAAP